MTVNGQAHALVVNFGEKMPRYPFNRRLCGPQIQSGCCEWGKYL